MGVARGLKPGRVVWVHDPDVTDWLGEGSGQRWWQHVDQAVAGDMMSQALREYAEQGSDGAAWSAIFREFNGGASYSPGEKIMIKVNLVTAHAGSGSNCADSSYNWLQGTDCSGVTIDSTANTPQLMIALLDQLVSQVGADPGDITIGDPTGLWVNEFFDPIHAVFPDVHYLDNQGFGDLGRERAEFTGTAEYNYADCEQHYWSTTDADAMDSDCSVRSYYEADYLINFAVLKTHEGAGVTLAAKNHYGSLLRTPIVWGRTIPGKTYYDLHDRLPLYRTSPDWEGMGHYRPLVDMMGYKHMGGKTLLYLIDAVYGGHNWHSEPYMWQMAPFNNDWPSSLFLSMDPVAIDSVAFDFLAHEWENWPSDEQYPTLVEGVQDYLHEAALANSPPSGTFYDPERDGTPMASLGTHEHWNNPTEKQYSRNLDPANGRGIELVYIGDQFTWRSWDLSGSTSYGVYDQDNSTPLQTGDKVQLLYAGADGLIDPPTLTGTPGDDDQLLQETSIMSNENKPPPLQNHGYFLDVVFTYDPSAFPGTPLVYARAWNASSEAGATHYGDSLPTILEDDVTHNFDRWHTTHRKPAPLAVTLASFTASPLRGSILLTWETATETDLLGFNLVRADNPEGERLLLNEDLIPCRMPGSLVGATYELEDHSTVPGVTYFYWLEAVDHYGESRFHGPVMAALASPQLGFYVPVLAE
jgi:hypothetical protein